MQEVDFTVSLIDELTKPLKMIDQTILGAEKSFAKFKSTVKNASPSSVFKDLRNTGDFIEKSQYATQSAVNSLKSLVQPARDVSNALGEVKSLGVSDDALQKLQKSALEFTNVYGGSAAEIISSSYDIQSAIGGLSGEELARFSYNASLMAKGTKANFSTVTDFMGTMYGIFQEKADAMGKAEWIDQMGGQYAKAVQMFKTTGSQMAASFSRIGSEAQKAGISQAEQFAILGKMQMTMSGSEAGTRYVAFLNNVGKAGKYLGLSFTDAEGKMLSLPLILERIQGKFGDIDTVAKADLLKKAFGSKEAVSLIKNLSGDIDGLKKNINDISHVTGLKDLKTMAGDISDPFDALDASVTNFTTVFGQTFMPLLVKGINVVTGWIIKLQELTQEYPNLTKYVGISIVTIGGLTVGVTLLTSAFGLLSGSFSVVLGVFGIASKVLVFLVPLVKTLGLAFSGFFKILSVAAMGSPLGFVFLLVKAIGLAVIGVKALASQWDGLADVLRGIADTVRSIPVIGDVAGNFFDWMAGDEKQDKNVQNITKQSTVVSSQPLKNQDLKRVEAFSENGKIPAQIITSSREKETIQTNEVLEKKEMFTLPPQHFLSQSNQSYQNSTVSSQDHIEHHNYFYSNEAPDAQRIKEETDFLDSLR